MQDDADSFEYIPLDHDGCMKCLADGCYQYGEGAQHKQRICESPPLDFSLLIQILTPLFNEFEWNFNSIPVIKITLACNCARNLHIYE